MTAPQQATSATKDEAANVARTATDSASAVAGSATTAAADVTGAAKEQAANVIGEGLDQAKDLVETVRTQVGEQVSTQSDRLTTGLRSISTQLNEGDTSGVVGKVLSEAGQRIEQFAGHVERAGPQGLVDDLRAYAKRNPGTFLLGAAVAGLVSGRLAKGLSAGKQTSAPPAPRAAGTAAGDPLAGVTAPRGTGVTAGYVPAPDLGTSYGEPVASGTSPYPPAPEGASSVRDDQPIYGSPGGQL